MDAAHTIHQICECDHRVLLVEWIMWIPLAVSICYQCINTKVIWRPLSPIPQTLSPFFLNSFIFESLALIYCLVYPILHQMFLFHVSLLSSWVLLLGNEDYPTEICHVPLMHDCALRHIEKDTWTSLFIENNFPISKDSWCKCSYM